MISPNPTMPLEMSASLPLEIDAVLEAMRYPELAELREQISVFKRIPNNLSGYPVARPKDCMLITDRLDDFFQSYERRFTTSDQYILSHFFSMIDDFSNSDIKAYPMEVLRLKLVKAQALVASGNAEEALALIAPFAQRPYLIEDNYGVFVKIIEIDTLARLSCGRVDELREVSMGRLRLLTSLRRINARKLFVAMAPIVAMGKTNPSEPGDGLITYFAKQILNARRWRARHKSIRIIAACHAIQFVSAYLGASAVVATRRRWHKSDTQIRQSAPIGETGSTEIQQLIDVSSPEFAKRKPILVSRAMGGLGDVAMMTPGVNALVKRYNQPVYFATKKAFFPIFENNPDVKLVDIDSYFDLGQFRRWYNLSNCPASRYESATAPNIKKSRVESFGMGMGVKRRALNKFGWKPIIPLSDEQNDITARFRAQYGSKDRPLIGIQPYSRDTYKNCDAIFDAARKLSEHYRVVIMHTSPVPIESSENIIVLSGQSLREVLALIPAMDYYIAVDSAFYHITAAYDVPTLGIFGPTNGVTLSRHHGRHHLVKQRVDFPCAPCWRNENSPCILTRNNQSACLNSITAEHLCDDFEVLRKKFPMAADAYTS